MDYSKNTALIDIVPVANKVLEIYKREMPTYELVNICREVIYDMDPEQVSAFMPVWHMLTGTAPLVINGKITYDQYISRARCALPLIAIQDLPKLNLKQLNLIKETVRIQADAGSNTLDYISQLNNYISALEVQLEIDNVYSAPDAFTQILDNIYITKGLPEVNLNNAPPMPDVKPPNPDQSIVVVDDFTKVANGLVQLLVKAGVLNKADDEPIEQTMDIQQELAQAITLLINVQQSNIDNAARQSSNPDTSMHRVITIGVNNYNESLAAVLSIAHENDVILIPHGYVSLIRELRVKHNHAHLYTINVLASTNEIHTLTKYTINNVFIIGEATQSEYIENVYQLCNQHRNQKIILID